MGTIVVTADVVIEYPDGGIVLIKRGKEPFLGSWALPGEILEEGETIEECAVREAKEETEADPVEGSPRAASDAADLIITRDFRDLALAFDHAEILRAAFPNDAPV